VSDTKMTKKTVVRSKVCRTCGGTGKVFIDCYGMNLPTTVTCMTCDGTGKQGTIFRSHVSPDRMADGRDA
jgi:DnaJ-class molecular chaperone